VREGRRVEGKWMFTAHDALPESSGLRPKVHRRSVLSSHYAIDSHAMHKRESGKKTLDGFISYQTKPFTVPFEVMVPVDQEQILCPVPVSASHVGFGCLRMEPCWMGLGQAAGIAAALAIRQNKVVSKISIDSLQSQLLLQKANLIYVSDIGFGHPDYQLVQKVALSGWLPEYEARLDQMVQHKDLELWSSKSGFSVQEIEEFAKNKTRKEALVVLYRKYNEAFAAKN
jgi:hypothetical protein